MIGIFFCRYDNSGDTDGAASGLIYLCAAPNMRGDGPAYAVAPSEANTDLDLIPRQLQFLDSISIREKF